MVFALKEKRKSLKKIVIVGYINKNQRRNRRLNNLKKKVRKKEKTKQTNKQKRMILKIVKIYLVLL